MPKEIQTSESNPLTQLFKFFQRRENTDKALQITILENSLNNKRIKTRHIKETNLFSKELILKHAKNLNIPAEEALEQLADILAYEHMQTCGQLQGLGGCKPITFQTARKRYCESTEFKTLVEYLKLKTKI